MEPSLPTSRAPGAARRVLSAAASVLYVVGAVAVALAPAVRWLIRALLVMTLATAWLMGTVLSAAFGSDRRRR